MITINKNFKLNSNHYNRRELVKFALKNIEINNIDLIGKIDIYLNDNEYKYPDLIIEMSKELGLQPGNFKVIPEGAKNQIEGGIIEGTTEGAQFIVSEITEEILHQTAKQFVGEQDQMPPIFSAKKVDGEKAYVVARKGGEINLKTNRVTIKEFELTKIDLPNVEFKASVTKGTYIRSLAYDFGKALNNGAHLSVLRRTVIGDFKIEFSENTDIMYESSYYNHIINSLSIPQDTFYNKVVLDINTNTCLLNLIFMLLEKNCKVISFIKDINIAKYHKDIFIYNNLNDRITFFNAEIAAQSSKRDDIDLFKIDDLKYNNLCLIHLDSNNFDNIINVIDEQKKEEIKKLRDRSIILIGFSGGFRRNEIVSLDYEDLDFVPEGLKINIKRSKTDQFGEGSVKGLPYFENPQYCPVVSIQKWIKISKIHEILRCLVPD